MKLRIPANRIGQLISVLLISLGITLFLNFSSMMSSDVHNQVETNWRTSYDILVRPAQSNSFLDYSGQRLIEPNFLSGQQGGITQEQYDSIRSIPGVEVAAPISMVGYFPLGYMTYADEVVDQPTAPWAIYKDVRTITIRDNLRTFTARDTTYTIHDRRDSFGVDPAKFGSVSLITPDGKGYSIEGLLDISDASSTTVRVLGRELCVSKDGEIGGHSFNTAFDLYVLVAGIDPSQEQALVGLQDAVSIGRYLKNDDQPRFEHGIYWYIPVLSNRISFRDIDVQDTTYGLEVPAGDDLAEKLHQDGLNYLESLSGHILQEDANVSLMDSFSSTVENAIRNNGAIGGAGGPFSEYLLPNPVQYSQVGELPGFPLVLEAKPVGISNLSPISSVPLSPGEVIFRQELTQKILYKGPDNYSATNYEVNFLPIGSFDLAGLPSNPLNEVPMESYSPPAAILRFDEQGVEKDPVTIRPTNNPLGYLSDTPLALMTLESAHFLAKRDDFISAIRVRVEGVDQLNEQAQTKIERIAREIEAQTGLQVDITLGSSPQPVLVHIPGYQNAPGLGYFEEHWIRQLVGITINRGVNKADLLFFASILFSCCMYVYSSASFNILRKQKEIGIVGAIGWRPSIILGSMLKDAAGWSIIALAASFVLSGSFILTGLVEYSFSKIFFAVPLILFIYVSGTAYAAWRAAAETPIDAITGNEPSSREAAGGLVKLIVNSRHSIPAWLAMSISMGAFIFIIAVSYQLKGLMVGSLLGEAISLQFQPYHYILLAIILLISGSCILETLLTRLVERRSEIGLLKAIGWQNKSIFGLFMKEGLTLSLAGGITGTLLGLFMFRGFYSAFPKSALPLIVLGIALPCLLGGLASLHPAYLATCLDPIDIIHS